jgi:hypothetical protein
MRAPYRNRFDPSLDFEARRRVTVGGFTTEPGEAFDKTSVGERKLRQMFAQRTIVYRGEKPGAKLSAEEVAATERGKHSSRAADRRNKATSSATPKPPKAKKPGKGAKAPPATETVHGADAVRVARAAVEIPADWKTQPWPDRLKLAAQLTDDPVKNGEDVAKAIEAELARRGTS